MDRGVVKVLIGNHNNSSNKVLRVTSMITKIEINTTIIRHLRVNNKHQHHPNENTVKGKKEGSNKT
jgi:hypothetical protein